MNDNNIFFRDMKGMKFGVWIAHKEGRFINTSSLKENQKVLKYCTLNSDKYPQNPNGSEDSLAGVCSLNNRHLALMPHPERCFLKWQIPYLSKYSNISTSPWLKMFDNMFNWCQNYDK